MSQEEIIEFNSATIAASPGFDFRVHNSGELPVAYQAMLRMLKNLHTARRKSLRADSQRQTFPLRRGVGGVDPLTQPKPLCCSTRALLYFEPLFRGGGTRQPGISGKMVRSEPGGEGKVLCKPFVVNWPDAVE